MHMWIGIFNLHVSLTGNDGLFVSVSLSDSYLASFSIQNNIQNFPTKYHKFVGVMFVLLSVPLWIFVWVCANMCLHVFMQVRR